MQDQLALGTGQASPLAMAGLTKRKDKSAQAPSILTWGREPS